MKKINYKFKKFKIYLRRLLFKKYNLNLNEQLIKKTLIKLLSDDKTTISLFPISDMIYIQTPNKEYTVILDSGKIKITNHQLFIETYLNSSFSSSLISLVHKCLDRRKTQMDTIIFNNESDGLTYILNSLTNKNNEIYSESK
jgi:hypothetical protein